MIPKLNQLSLITSEYDIDILCVTEHWLTEQQIGSFNVPNYDIISSYERSVFKHGGVLIAVKNKWKASEIEIIKQLSIEKIFETTAIFIPNMNSVIVVVYRSPASGFELFIERLQAALAILSSDYSEKQIVLAGDFNINFLEKTKELKEMMDLLESFGLIHLFNEPSRLSKTSQSCIDNIFINNSEGVHGLTRELHISDHMGQLIYIPNRQDKPENRKAIVKVREVGDQNTCLFRQQLRLVDWDGFFCGKSAQQSFSSFHELLLQLFDEYMPEKDKSINRTSNGAKWKTPEIVEMKNKLDALYTICKVKRDLESERSYKIFKEAYKHEIQMVRKRQTEVRLSNSSNKQKTVWRIINEEKQRPIYNSIDIAPDQLNNFFANVGNNIVNQLPDVKQTPNDLIKNLQVDTTKSFCLFECSLEEVERAFQSLKIKNTCDIYNLSTGHLKLIWPEIVNPLTTLINMCFRETYFPKELKIAKVAALYKGKGEKLDCGNYRPISILPCLSKVFELILKNRIMRFMEKTQLFTENQHGYRVGRSTTTALLRVTDYIAKELNMGHCTKMMNLDLSKAFDSVTHRLLLDKLMYYGFRGQIHKLIDSYLKERSQFVVVNGKISGERAVNCGVPQGSILGPVLFIIYINDLQVGRSLYTCLYCDDTSFLISDKDETLLEEKCREIMLEANNWFVANKLKVNCGKTETLTFGHKYPQRTVKFLGVNIDSRLNWSIHIEKVCKQISRNIYCLRRLKKIAGPQVLKTAYYSNVHSHLTYGIIIWGSSSESKRLLILQKKAIRVILNLKPNESCKQHFKEEKILTLTSLYILECLKYVHGNLNAFPKNGRCHHFNTRNKNDLRIPRHLRASTQQFVDYWGTKFYNKLPEDVRILTKSEFARSVKDTLTNGAFYTFDEFLNDCTF